MSNVTHLPPLPYSVEAMRGPDRYGSDVFIDGHLVPNMWMVDNGETVELCFPGPVHFIFPREIAPHAAALAAKAMAVGAGHAGLAGLHSSTKPYGTPVIEIK